MPPLQRARDLSPLSCWRARLSVFLSLTPRTAPRTQADMGEESLPEFEKLVAIDRHTAVQIAAGFVKMR